MGKLFIHREIQKTDIWICLYWQFIFSAFFSKVPVLGKSSMIKFKVFMNADKSTIIVLPFLFSFNFQWFDLMFSVLERAHKQLHGNVLKELYALSNIQLLRKMVARISIKYPLFNLSPILLHEWDHSLGLMTGHVSNIWNV